MTAVYVLSPRAKADIDRIWTDTANRWGLDQAESYVRQIARTLETLAVHPSIGRACPEVRVGYRKYPSGSHVVFYKSNDGGVDVVRILHERMDFGRHL